MNTQRAVRSVALAGGVGVSRRVLEALLRHGVPVSGVCGLEPANSASVSGYARLDDLAAAARAPYVGFRNVNDPLVLKAVEAWRPDLLFVVGLSQIVRSELLAVPRLGCVGFHPTRLPEARGRAPVPWMILEGRSGAATFFLMDSGADSGPIVAQSPFHVDDDAYASEIHERIENAIDRALDAWLPGLAAGAWEPRVQDESLATYRARRGPEDGLIDWTCEAQSIARLVRATSRPYPGAYTYFGSAKLVVWRAEVYSAKRIRGVIGRVVEIEADQAVVQTGNGLLRLIETEHSGLGRPLRIGDRLGLSVEDCLKQFSSRVAELEQLLENLRGRGDGVAS